jgi:YesN/AraC family two-component response regulator
MISISVLVMIFIGLVVAIGLAYRSSKPMRLMVRFITERTQKPVLRAGTFDWLENTFSELFHDHERLQNKIKEQLPTLKTIFFERLLRGEFKTDQEVESFMHYLGIEFHGSMKQVALVHIQGYQEMISEDILLELNRKKVLIEDAMGAVFPASAIHIHQMDEDKMAVIMPYHQDELGTHKQVITEQWEQVFEQTAQIVDLRFTISLGNHYSSVIDLSRSYEDAMAALKYAQQSRHKGLIWHDELSLNHSGFYYPAELENRLMNYVKAGDHENVAKLLEDVYQNNFVYRHLSIPMVRVLYYVIWGSLLKLQEQMDYQLPETIDVQMIAKLIEKEVTPDLMFRRMTDAFNQLCQVVNVNKKSHNHELKQEILAYIQSQFASSDLSLDAIAEHFDLSMKYVSNFFKEQTGTTFTDYLNDVRMRHARKLLSTTQLSVNEITLKVGYQSTNTFCRAFKRTHGLSPTVFRSSNQTVST